MFAAASIGSSVCDKPRAEYMGTPMTLITPLIWIASIGTDLMATAPTLDGGAC